MFSRPLLKPPDHFLRSPLIPYLSLVGFAMVYCLAALTLQNDFWIEDDTMHLVFVRDHPNPFSYFTREGITAFSFGRTVTPMLPLSFWIDYQMAPFSTVVAYLHASLAATLATLLLFAVLRRVLTTGQAFITAALWLLLPSTISVIEFLAARHYLEGIIFMLAAILATFRAIDTKSPKSYFWASLAVVAYLLACCCKEIYVTNGFWLPFCICIYRKRWDLAPFSGVGPLLYFCYRFTAIGLVGKGFDSSWDYAERYHEFLEIVPFLFSGSNTGLLLFALFVPVIGSLLWRKDLDWRQGAFWLTNLILLLATIFPVTEHLAASYHKLGTWYRIAFLYNTFLLFTGAWLLGRCTLWWRIPMTLVSIVVVLPGTVRAIEKWDHLKQWHRADAEYYLEHQGQLFYTSLPAPWFMQGVHTLFAAEKPRNYITHSMTAIEVRERFNRHDVIWSRDRFGHYQSDPLLYRTIAWNAKYKVRPLHKPVAPQKLDPLAQPGTPESFAEMFTYHGDGVHILNGEPEILTKGPSASLLQIPLPPKDAEALFIAVDGGEDARFTLAGHNLDGTVLFRSDYDLNARSFLFESPDFDEDIARLALSSDQPVNAMLIRRESHLGWRARTAQPPTPPGEWWVAHVPVDGHTWSYRLVVANASTEPGIFRLNIIDENGAVQHQDWSVPGYGLRMWTPELDNSATAMSIDVLDHGLTIRQHITWKTSGVIVDMPLTRPSPLRLNLGENNDLYGSSHWGLAVFNPGDQPCRLKHLDATGMVRQSWMIGSKEKLLVSSESILRDKLGTRLETDQSVVSLWLHTGENGALSATQPR